MCYCACAVRSSRPASGSWTTQHQRPQMTLANEFDRRDLCCVQWRSKALRGPGSTVTWWPSIASAQGLKLEAQSAERGGGALGRACYPGLGSGVSSPSGVPSCQSFWCFLCSQMTSPVIENPARTAQVYHFTHFYHACKNDSSVVGLGHPHVERN